jgi:hypothetical protein
MVISVCRGEENASVSLALSFFISLSCFMDDFHVVDNILMPSVNSGSLMIVNPSCLFVKFGS